MSPQIPTYISQTQAQSAQYPQHAGSGIISGDEGISAGFNRLAAGVKSITDKIQKQNEDLNVSELLGQYNSGIKDIQLNLPQQVENPEKWQAEFDRQESDLRRSLEKQTYNGNALVKFRTHTNQIAPLESIRVKHDAQIVTIQDQNARMFQVGVTQAKVAAEAQTPTERDAAIAIFTNPNATNPDDKGILEKSRAQGRITPIQEQHIRSEFMKDVATRYMQHIANTQPDSLWAMQRAGKFNNVDENKQFNILNSTRTKIEVEDQRNKKVSEEAHKLVYDDAYSKAANGMLTEDYLQNIIDKKDPVLLAQDGVKLKHLNDNPIGGEGHDQVGAIMLDYESGSPTLSRVLKYREELNNLRNNIEGRPPKSLGDAFRRLQVDERAAQTLIAQQAGQVRAEDSQFRAQTGFDKAQAEYNVKKFVDAYKAANPITMPGNLGAIQRNRQKAEIAEGSIRARNGEDPEKIVKEFQQKAKDRLNRVPQRNQEVIDLVR